MIVNKRDSYKLQVDNLHREISIIRYQLANIKVEARLTALLDIVGKKQMERKTVAMTRIQQARRNNKQLIPLLLEVSIRKLSHSYCGIRQRLLMQSFMAVRLHPYRQKPLQPYTDSTMKQMRRRDLSNGRKEPAYDQQNIDLKQKIKFIESTFKEFVKEIQKQLPDVQVSDRHCNF